MSRLCLSLLDLQELNVLSLPSLCPFDHVELDCLAFLKALESITLNGAKVDKYILTALPRDKAKSLGIVKPFYCSLFHLLFHTNFLFEFYVDFLEVGVRKARRLKDR
jgi:hypothetical protein